MNQDNETEKEREESDNKTTMQGLHPIYRENDLSYWYPMIKDAVPTPETSWLKVGDGLNLAHLLDGPAPDGPPLVYDVVCDALEQLAWKVGEPLFLRTGHGSGKHDWNRCCYVDSICDISKHVTNLVEWSHLVDPRGLPHDTWAVREMLDTEPLFHCERYGRMPVVREWRYFARGGDVLYGIPYWPVEALEHGHPDDPNWENHIEALHTEPEGGEELARAASEQLPGKWSVDVLVAADGLYVTDVALAKTSSGWDESKVSE